MSYHNPVLLNESIQQLISNPSGTYVDVTFGGGGHSRKILETIDAQGRLIAFDQDPDALKDSITDERFQFVPSNFRHLKKFLQYYNGVPADGILADLGVSSYQFDTAERGFSHRFDGELDMRMNKQKGISAREIINGYALERLANLFYTYGELNNGRRMAQQIVSEREKHEIATTGQLVEAITPLLPKGKENKILSQVFQAIRIEVNDEMTVLKEFLTQTAECLRPGGKLVVIAYHSLEDRLVKNFMRSGKFEGEVEKDFFGNPITPFKVLTHKAIIPDEQEITTNPRARSAKLRVVEKI
ncbi:MAG: 16S rRNA (cytosine(1402)-N(4))-methyltransferase RsmH [Bacteroidales bacterium]|nr:16S rRNA (cytosine(1402)-N(4))-methyltransferase RsmH [Bacteroidales bacterium]